MWNLQDKASEQVRHGVLLSSPFTSATSYWGHLVFRRVLYFYLLNDINYMKLWGIFLLHHTCIFYQIFAYKSQYYVSLLYTNIIARLGM